MIQSTQGIQMQKWIKLTKNWGSQKVNDVLEMDEASAKSLVDTGYAEYTPSPESDIVEKSLQNFTEVMSKAMASFMAKAGEVIEANSAVKRPEIKAGFSETDKKKSFGDFLANVFHNDVKVLETVYGSKAGLAESTGTAGGYTVPPEFMAKLLSVQGEEAIVRPRAFTIPMSSRSILIPALDQTTVRSTGISPYFGGMQAKWVDETGSRPETDPTFKQIELVARELTGYTPVSRNLLQDSAIGLDTLLTSMFGKLITWHEDYAFLAGDGVGKPRGITNSAACLTVTRSGSGAFALADVANMWSKLLPTSQNKAVWIMSQSLIPKLIQLADAAGRVVFMPTAPSGSGSISGAMPMQLLGRPVYFTEKLPALGTTGDVLLADLSMYIVADRGSLEVAASEHALFLTNQMAWRFIKRVEGQPWMDNYVTYQDGATTVSPFVKLSTL